MGYTGLVSFAIDPQVIPDLAFFNLILINENFFLIVAILILAIALTLSTIDTLINAISSLIIIDGKVVNKYFTGKKIQDKTNKVVLILCLLVFIFASQGFSILYLFLIADLLCCSAVITIFYGFYKKKIDSKLAIISILSGLISGLLFFPSQNFQSSILVGNIISIDSLSPFISTNLLFISFAVSLILPMIIIIFHSLRNSLR